MAAKSKIAAKTQHKNAISQIHSKLNIDFYKSCAKPNLASIISSKNLNFLELAMSNNNASDYSLQK